MVVAPEKPSSLNTFLLPAFFKAASCRAGVWSSVDTRAEPYFMTSLCNGHLHHAKPFIYAGLRNGAKLMYTDPTVPEPTRACDLKRYFAGFFAGFPDQTY